MIHVSYSFGQMPDTQLDQFTTNVVTSMTGNKSFPTPKVTMASLSSAQSAFETALAACPQGGTEATVIKNNARDALVDLLRQQAVYLQGIAFDDLAMLLSSGFLANSTSRTQTELGPTVVLSVDNEASTQLVVNLQPVDNARAYEVQTSTGTGQWQHAGTYTYTRNAVVENLTPGATYNIRARAVGGSTGYSIWSDPVSHMAT